MSLFSKKSLLSSIKPLIQFQRNRGKINIQKPRLPHYERQRVVAVTQPIYETNTANNVNQDKKMHNSEVGNCFTKNPRIKQLPLNPYNTIIAREVMNWIRNSRMIVIFHMNSISADELFNIRVKLHQQNMHLKYYGKKIVQEAVKNTKYENILTLFSSEQYIVFSPELNVSKLLRITRKVPQLILLAGIIDNNMLLSRNELIDYGNLPSLQTVQAQLVQTLNLAPQTLIQHLSTHQQKLIDVLNVIEKQKTQKNNVIEENAEILEKST